MLKRPDDALPHYKNVHKFDPANSVYEQSLQKLEQSLKEAKENSPRKIDLYASFGLELKSSRLGVMVKKLKPGWRAAQAGLYPDDVIKTIDGIPINQMSQVAEIIGSKPIDHRFQMVLVRRGMACQLMF